MPAKILGMRTIRRKRCSVCRYENPLDMNFPPFLSRWVTSIFYSEGCICLRCHILGVVVHTRTMTCWCFACRIHSVRDLRRWNALPHLACFLRSVFPVGCSSTRLSVVWAGVGHYVWSFNTHLCYLRRRSYTWNMRRAVVDSCGIL